MSPATSQENAAPQLSQRECARLFKSEKTGVLHLRQRDGAIVRINPCLTGILNCDARDVTGKPLASLGALPDESAKREKVRHLIDAGHLRYDDLPLSIAEGACARFSLRRVRREEDVTVVECVLHDVSSLQQLADESMAESDEFIARTRAHQDFTAYAEREVERARRYGRPLSLLSIEIDRNRGDEEHPHNRIGDLSLKTFAEACNAVLRRSDTVGRVGEARFVALLPESTVSEAEKAAETLRMAIEYMEQPTRSGFSTRVTVSIGAASAGETYEEMLMGANAMLKVARIRGGNCVASSRSALH